VEIKPSLAEYWPNKAADACAIEGFMLNEHGLISRNKFEREKYDKRRPILCHSLYF
jgi:hypothetical protein